MKPEDRAALVDLMRRSRDEIPAEIARLQQQQDELTAWLTEFAAEQEEGEGDRGSGSADHGG